SPSRSCSTGCERILPDDICRRTYPFPKLDGCSGTGKPVPSTTPINAGPVRRREKHAYPRKNQPPLSYPIAGPCSENGGPATGFKTRIARSRRLFIEHAREVATSLANTSCDVADWHFCDITSRARHVRFGG